MLLLIPRRTQVASPSTEFTFSEAELNAAREGFLEVLPSWVSEITENRLCVVPEVVVSERTLKSFSNVCGAPIPWAADVKADLDEYAPKGRYDSVVLYAPNGGDAPNCGGGPDDTSNLATFAYVIPRGEAAWLARKDDVYDAIIHEWMHGVIGFYENKPGVGPVPNIDSAGSYGYEHDPDLGWKQFLGDVLNRKVAVDGTLRGLGDPAWSYGDIRHHAAYASEAYLTPKRRATNLLTNGSFEQASGGIPSGWRIETYAESGSASQTRDVHYAGAASARLVASAGEDLRLVQSVKVRPNKRYLFAGWARAEAVSAEAGTGVNLGSRDEAHTSRSLIGTAPWTYLSVILSSGERTTLNVSASLGYWGSLATGSAWFDDLHLIELPD
jgi:hypothetical protein